MAQSLAAFTPIKFALKTVDLLYNDTLYPSITNTKYEGQIKDSGDRVRVRTAAKISLSAYTKGMALVAQDLNPTSEDLIIDQQHYFKFVVDDVDKFQNDIPTMTEYSKNVKNDMEDLIDIDLLTEMRKNVGMSADATPVSNAVGTDYATGTISIVAVTGVVTGSGTTFTAAMVGGYLKSATHTAQYLVTAFASTTSITVTDLDGVSYTGGTISAEAYNIAAATALAVTKSNIYAQMVAIRTSLGKSLSPKADRFVVFNSQAEGLLMQAPEFIPAVQTAYSDVVVKGLIGKIAGFNVFCSEHVDGDNTDGYWFVAGNKEYMAFAAQIMKTSMLPSEADPNSFTATAKGLLVYGRKVFEGNRAHGAVLRATLA
jgi:hypothetical protein